MNLGQTNGHGMDDDPIPDGVAEELLAGRYDKGAPDLVALSQLLRRARALGERPAPLPPSAALAEILAGSTSADGGTLPVAAERGVGPEDVQVAPRRLRRGSIKSRTLIAAVIGLVLAVALAAGSAGLLPGAGLAGRILRTVTPFELPEPSEPAPAPSTRSDAAPVGGSELRPPPPGESSPAGDAASAADPSQPVAGGADGGSPPPDVTTPGSGTTARPGSAAPGPPAAGQTTTTVPVPPAAPPPAVFQVDLIGPLAPLPVGDPNRHGTAVLVADSVRRELCLTLVLSGLAPVTSAHLHAGPHGVTGSIVAAFDGPRAGTSIQCVPAGDQLLAEIHRTPEAYYLDVHSLQFPTGTVRGQLHR